MQSTVNAPNFYYFLFSILYHHGMKFPYNNSHHHTKCCTKKTKKILESPIVQMGILTKRCWSANYKTCETLEDFGIHIFGLKKKDIDYLSLRHFCLTNHSFETI